MRKVIQINIITNKFLGMTTGYRVFALCDDGTLWYKDNSSDIWIKMEDKIPNTNM